MNKLKTGHQVIAWDNDKSSAEVGTFLISHDNHHLIKCNILLTGEIAPNLDWFKNCELDPNADTFLPGDDVLARCGNGQWVKATYIGHRGHGISLKPHLVAPLGSRDSNLLWTKECQYQLPDLEIGTTNKSLIDDARKKLAQKVMGDDPVTFTDRDKELLINGLKNLLDK